MYTLQMLRTILFYLIVIFITLITAVCGVIFYTVHHKVIDFSVLIHHDAGQPSILLDDRGIEWTRFELDKREPITIDQMPEQVINAFIAAEDWDFFKHKGLSFKGIIRSLLVNIYYGCKLQGASTITQQLVKLLFLDSQKTFSRKIKEQLYALLVEQQFSKKQILQTYLNHVYFGCGIYGVQAASHRFWGKEIVGLDIDQAATLAGIVRAPSYYCPLNYPLSAQQRRDTVLHKMKRLGFITEQQLSAALAQPMKIKDRGYDYNAPHMREYIRQLLEEKIGKKQLYTGGFIIKTTVNQEIQQQAEKEFKQHIKQLRYTLLPDVDGGLISIDVKTGDIKALVGGYDFLQSKFNRALQARRQMGSTFKPILYAAAVEQGKNFHDTQIDAPFILEQGGKTWQPRNFNRQFVGEITLAYALSRSNNIASIKTFLEIGPEPVIALAKKSRINGPLYPYPSLALGCVDATLKEVVGMFNIFANDGVYVEPHLISWVKDRWGKKIMKTKIIQERIISTQVSGKVAKVLGIGIGRYQSMVGYKNKLTSEAICKTGTTNDSRTCWFTGATPELTTGVYIGCDDNRSMGYDIYPVHTAFPIWLALNKVIIPMQKQFNYDPTLQTMIIDEKTGAMVAYGTSQQSTIEILV